MKGINANCNLIKEKALGSKDSSSSMGIPNHQQGCKGVQRPDNHFLHMGLVSHNSKPHNTSTSSRPPPLFISYVSPEQTKQDQHQMMQKVY